MCKDCKYVIKDGKKLICMCEESKSQYEHVPKDFVCDEYEPEEQ